MVSVQASLQLIKEALRFLGTALTLTGYLWPESVVVQDAASYKYIVVGGGTAGCIIANRLAENDQVQVLLIEAGGDPPLESILTGLFATLVRSIHDWSYRAVDDHQVGQYTVNKSIALISGKLLGGSSSLNHGLYVRGHPKDFDSWAEIINDNAWNFENLLHYLKKPEKMVVQEILESENSELYGKDGYVILTKDSEDINDKYLKAFEEVGHKTLIDINGLKTLGYTELVMHISVDGIRQSMAESYLRRFKNKANLHVMKNTEVIKILFDDNKNAIGVVARNQTTDFEIYATKEVVVTAGVFNTPKLLMLSGIGPREHLEMYDIEVISDLPVGKNLQDHNFVILLHKMAPSNTTKKPRDPHRFPLPSFVGFGAVNKSQEVPDYCVTNVVIDNDPAIIQQLSVAIFNFVDQISETFACACNGNEVLASVVTQVYPKSRGTVELKSHDPRDPPLIYLNALSDEQDVTDFARILQHFLEVQQSEYFKSVNAELIVPDVIGCDHEDELEFLECYAKAMVSTSFHQVGTCSLGAVVDTNLYVKGVQKLRVADASVIPKITSGKMMSPVMAVAEKAADLIKNSCS